MPRTPVSGKTGLHRQVRVCYMTCFETSASYSCSKSLTESHHGVILQCFHSALADQIDKDHGKKCHEKEQDVSHRTRSAQVQRAPINEGLQGQRFGGRARAAI